MTAADYREPCPASNSNSPTLTAVDHLQLASLQLEQEASESRKDSAKLRRLAHSLGFIATLLEERVA